MHWIFMQRSLALSFLAIACALPLGPESLSGQSLLGSSFGIPGDQSFDYVIVGGGTAGLAVANRLSEDPSMTVAVIEAGGFYEIQNGNTSQIPLEDAIGTDKTTKNYNPLVDWGFVTAPQKALNGAVSHYARGKTLGGSSARNYMAYQRGTIDSYNMWADLVGDSSYKWDQWLPYFQKSLNFTPPNSALRAANATPSYDAASLGKGGGPVSVTFSNYAQAISSWVQKGLYEIGIQPRSGFTSGALFGSSYVLETIQAENQIRETSETAFLKPALSRSNLYVFTESLAEQIVFDGKKQATGVKVNTAGKSYTLSANREIVLSAGAFQSPQLLMVSGVGPAATLRKYGISVVADRSGVGQNMWDHIFFGSAYRVNVVTGSSLGSAEFAAQAIQQYANQQGILTNSGGDLFAWEKLPNASRNALSHSVQSALAKFPSDWPELEYLTVGGFLGNNTDFTAITPHDGYNYASVVAALVAPLSRGTIGISSNSMNDPPIIDPQWLSDPTDQAVAVAAYKRLRQLFSTKSMAPVLFGPEYYPGHSDNQTDAELLSIIKTGYQTVWHASCTCKMGKTSDNMAVVDSKARVIGVSNLRVVDASSFALLPPGHPISTIYALAEKISDDIKGNRTQ